MKKLEAADTTVRASSPRAGTRQARTLGVCWTFPSPKLTPLEARTLTLGRGEECDVVLPGRETSRQHASLTRRGPIWVATDLGSTNGIFVDGTRVDEAPLDVGTVLRIGEWVGVIEAAPEPSLLQCPHFAHPGLIVGPGLAGPISVARRVAASDLPVIVEGQTGTGKECVARAVHAWSGRRGAFVAINCATLPEPLAESELFGYRRGAFTGAARDSAGYFRAAHAGTLFLDEIAELPPTIQAKLLRAIEQREVQPLGESRPVAVDVRLVVAAQEPLAHVVDAGRFRPDLYARLDGVTVELPPLKERRSDAAAIFIDVLGALSGGAVPNIDPQLIERVCLYDWPYNVRELVQVTRRLLVLHGKQKTLRIEHLPAAVAGRALPDASPVPASAREPGPGVGRKARRTEALFARLSAALSQHGGNVSKACAEIGLSRQQGYRLLEKRPIDLEALRYPAVGPDDEAGT